MFEFEDDTHPLSTPPAKPIQNEVYINIVNGRAMVSKYGLGQGNVWAWQPCLNWEDLEHEAMECAESVTRGMVRQTYYACPLRISERALWGRAQTIKESPIHLRNV